MRNRILLSSFALLLYLSCHHSTGKKVKKIALYNVDGHVEYNKAAEVFKSSINPYLVQQYDSAGKLVRENGYDNDGNEDNVVEYKYDENNKLVEKINYKNFYMRPLGRTYSEKYVYRNNLLVETYYYYGTGDNSGLFAKSERAYNDLDQVVKFQYNAFNDDGVNETRTYHWKDKFTYIEKRVNAQGNIERHFVKLDDKKNFTI